MQNVALAILLGLVPLAAAAWLWRRTERFPVHVVLLAAGGGAVAAALSLVVERAVLDFVGLGPDGDRIGPSSALLASFMLVGPLEEAAKVLAVWPFYTTRRITSRRSGLCLAVATAAGFAAYKTIALVLADPLLVLAVGRAGLSIPAHLGFAGIWGYALGAGGGQRRGRWFSIAWLVAMLLHSLYGYIVSGRGPGFWIAVVPLLALLAVALFIALRDVDARSEVPRESIVALPFEPPSLDEMRRALRTDKPLSFRWIGIGAFVTLGMMIACIAAAVWLGHRIGIDFAMADEADVRSSGPLMLLGAALLSAFPLAGYLVARASGVDSVLEPALGATLAIGVTLVMLSMTAPVAVVFALAVAPVAFGLACAGAWFGLTR